MSVECGADGSAALDRSVTDYKLINIFVKDLRDAASMGAAIRYVPSGTAITVFLDLSVTSPGFAPLGFSTWLAGVYVTATFPAPFPLL